MRFGGTRRGDQAQALPFIPLPWERSQHWALQPSPYRATWVDVWGAAPAPGDRSTPRQPLAEPGEQQLHHGGTGDAWRLLLAPHQPQAPAVPKHGVRQR